MAAITPERIVQLKSEVKLECQRRNRTGSVASYGGTAYDYSVQPQTGSRVLKEHYTKNATPLNAISMSLPTEAGQIKENDIATMEAEVSRLSSIAMTASNGGCRSSCTGLCQTTCTANCANDCTGGCQGCGGNCTGGCTGCGSGWVPSVRRIAPLIDL